MGRTQITGFSQIRSINTNNTSINTNNTSINTSDVSVTNTDKTKEELINELNGIRKFIDQFKK